MTKIIEVLKQLQALLPGLLSFLTTRISIFPFLNPQIIEDLWPTSAIFGVIASGITYNLSRRFQKPTLGRKLSLFGLVIALLTFVGILALVTNVILPNRPELQDFMARSLFVFFFVGIGLASGYGMSNIA